MENIHASNKSLDFPRNSNEMPTAEERIEGARIPWYPDSTRVYTAVQAVI